MDYINVVVSCVYSQVSNERRDEVSEASLITMYFQGYQNKIVECPGVVLKY